MKLNSMLSGSLILLFVFAALAFNYPSNDPTKEKTGSVTGTITYDGSVPRLKAINMNAFPECAELHDGKVRHQGLVMGDGNGLANVFVQIKNPPIGKQQNVSEPAVMEMEGCLTSPRVLGVQVGQVLQFKNSDGILYKIQGFPKRNREFKVKLSEQGSTQEQTFVKPEGPFKVKCDVHPWVSGYVAVMTHPYFMVTDTDGRFEFTDIPDGDYEIEAWHERLGTRSGKVSIRGGVAEVNFTFQAPKRK